MKLRIFYVLSLLARSHSALSVLAGRPHPASIRLSISGDSGRGLQRRGIQTNTRNLVEIVSATIARLPRFSEHGATSPRRRQFRCVKRNGRQRKHEPNHRIACGGVHPWRPPRRPLPTAHCCSPLRAESQLSSYVPSQAGDEVSVLYWLNQEGA